MNVTPNNADQLGRYWHWLEDGRMQCDLCPRQCRLAEGQRGACFVRARKDDQMLLTTYGRSSGFCVDPIEKKPLNHFLPGTPVLSFGTAGCNLACKFCQNWGISKSREMDKLADAASPQTLAIAAKQTGSKSVAFTYNDPVIFLEYAVDTAIACREAGIKNVAVSAGYICPEPRLEFFRYMDAVNIDLKAFSEKFYKRITGSQLSPVLDTLQWLVHESNVWVEITTLLIPDENDSHAEIDAMTQWIANKLGVHVPLHFTAFHPDFKMRNKSRTPLETLIRARTIAKGNGLKYVYTGNVQHPVTAITYCHHCDEKLIARDRYTLSEWRLDEHGRCRQCHSLCEGIFEATPGTWGSKRMPIRMSSA